MTRVLFRKCYLLFAFFLCLSLWVIIKNVGLPEATTNELQFGGDKSAFQAQSLMSNALNKLEGEVAAQRVQSSILLDKIKNKFFPKPKTITEEDNNNVSKKLREEQDRMEGEELEKLRAQLNKIEPDGEILSEGEKASGKVIEGENKEVIDEEVNNKAQLTNNNNNEPVDPESVIAVVVFVCNRPTINRCLDSLFKYRPSAAKFPIVVSQDCGHHEATSNILQGYEGRITHIMQPDLSEISVPAREEKLKGYYKIARHYGWALNYTFNQLNYSNVLIVEDDLEVAPDFFEYFAATLPILKKDPSLWCVSAWNDNGKSKRINESAVDLLHRTDFFPGLGWMLTKSLWNELMVKWPRSYWDDWMREPAQRKGRACIRPEISRTSTFGKNGVSHGTYYQNHLRFIKLNQQLVPFTSLDLSYLVKDKYDVEFVRKVYSSQVLGTVKELEDPVHLSAPPSAEFRLTYRTREAFSRLAKKLEIMDDLRAGVPRTAYRGVVSFMFNGHRTYLAPGANWLGYQK